MISILSGIVVTGAGGASLWYFMPHNGVIHPLARKPLIDAFIPIGTCPRSPSASRSSSPA